MARACTGDELRVLFEVSSLKITYEIAKSDVAGSGHRDATQHRDKRYRDTEAEYGDTNGQTLPYHGDPSELNEPDSGEKVRMSSKSRVDRLDGDFG